MSGADVDGSTYKIVVLGDGSSGKTSIISRYAQDHFGKAYKQTVGLDFFSKTLDLPNDVRVTLQIWDIGGQSLGGKMLSNYLENANAVLLVYDVTNYNSFENLTDWVALVKKNCRSPKLHIALVANKKDLVHIRAVKQEDHNRFVAQHCASSHFVCAKTGDQVSVMFRMVVAALTGIAISAEETEREKRVLVAEIVAHPDAAPPPLAATPVPAAAKTNAKSKMCTLQ